MTSIRNKQIMYYALPRAEQEIYKRDENNNIVTFTDADGTVYAEGTGEYEQTYYTEVEFKANINGKLSEVTLQAFGIDNSANYCELITGKVRISGEPLFPLTIGTVIWRASEVTYTTVWDESTQQEITLPDGSGADYVVRGVVPESLNEVRYLLKRLKVAEE